MAAVRDENERGRGRDARSHPRIGRYQLFVLDVDACNLFAAQGDQCLRTVAFPTGRGRQRPARLQLRLELSPDPRALRSVTLRSGMSMSTLGRWVAASC